MGQKLSDFLQAFAGGLSPQVFQANLNKEAATTADTRLQEREVRAEDRNIRQISIQQGISSLGVLATAINDQDINTPEGKKKIDALMGNAKKITNGFKDPRIINAAKNSFAAQLGTKKKNKPSTELTKLQKQRTRLESIPQTSSTSKQIGEIDKRIAKISTITGTTEHDPGNLTKSQAGKLTLGGIEGETNVAKLVTGIDDYIKTVSHKDYVGGGAGEILGGLDSVLSQVQQLAGNDGYLKNNGDIDFDKLDLSKDSVSFLEKSAGQGGLAESQMLQLASVVAISNNPSGRVSDKDLEIAKRILGKGANPKVAAKLLGELQKRLIRNYNIEQNTISKSQGKTFKSLSIDGLRKLHGTEESKALDSRKENRRKRFEYP